MTLRLFLLFGLSSSNVFGQFDIPEYKIQDQRLLKVLSEMADTVNRLHKNTWTMQIYFDQSKTQVVHPQTTIPGAIEIDLTKKSLDIDLKFFVLVESAIWTIPTGYAVVKNVPCLVFTGIEPLMVEPKKALKKLQRKFKHRIAGMGGLSLSWQVHLTNDSLLITSGHKKELTDGLMTGGSR
jgi:hypothetical protein